jgi:hypothetical protein
MTGKTDNTGKKKSGDASPSQGDVHTPPASSPARLTDGTDAVAGGGTQQRSMRADGGNWPLLTRTNYADWAILMQVNARLQGHRKGRVGRAEDDATRCLSRPRRQGRDAEQAVRRDPV